MKHRHGLSRLESLTDAQLHALLVRAQTLLLDRPHDGRAFSVEVISGDEACLLALYRAMPPARRRRALAQLETDQGACARTATTGQEQRMAGPSHEEGVWQEG